MHSRTMVLLWVLNRPRTIRRRGYLANWMFSQHSYDPGESPKRSDLAKRERILIGQTD